MLQWGSEIEGGYYLHSGHGNVCASRRLTSCHYTGTARHWVPVNDNEHVCHRVCVCVCGALRYYASIQFLLIQTPSFHPLVSSSLHWTTNCRITLLRNQHLRTNTLEKTNNKTNCSLHMFFVFQQKIFKKWQKPKSDTHTVADMSVIIHWHSGQVCLMMELIEEIR